MSDADLRIKRLAVTLTRDGHWSRVNTGVIRDVLLYIDAPLEYVNKHAGSLPFDLSIFPNDYGDPRTIIELLNELIAMELLPQFLTELLRTAFSPENRRDFHTHLQPLGYDWDEKLNQVRPTTTHPEAEIAVRNELQVLLSGIDSGFPKMLDGAWEAFYSNNADKNRQTISSCRELLNQVIRKVSDGEQVERKERVRRILRSNSQGKVVESAASLVNAIYDVQSAAEHTTPDSSTALFVLVEAEHILYYLLKKRNSTS